VTKINLHLKLPIRNDCVTSKFKPNSLEVYHFIDSWFLRLVSLGALPSWKFEPYQEFERYLGSLMNPLSIYSNEFEYADLAKKISPLCVFCFYYIYERPASKHHVMSRYKDEWMPFLGQTES
jgi:hypothetical protein